MWAESAFFIGLGKVILMNLVLSGDNAVVIALACRHLAPEQQRKAYFWGSLGAVVLLTALTLVATSLLKIPYLQVAGGVLLLSLARNLLKGDAGHGEIKQHAGVIDAIKTIILADVVMSLDNTVAVAAVAQGDLVLIGVGLAVSIPLIIWGASLLTKLMDRFKLLVYAGAGLLAYSAGEMMLGDGVVGPYLQTFFGTLQWILPVSLVLYVLVTGYRNAQKVVTVRRYKRV